MGGAKTRKIKQKQKQGIEQLYKILKISDEDLELNKNGKLSSNQQMKLAQKRSSTSFGSTCTFIIIGLSITLFIIISLAGKLWNQPIVMGILSIPFFIIIIVMIIVWWKGFQRSRDLKHGKISEFIGILVKVEHPKRINGARSFKIPYELHFIAKINNEKILKDEDIQEIEELLSLKLKNKDTNMKDNGKKDYSKDKTIDLEKEKVQGIEKIEAEEKIQKKGLSGKLKRVIFRTVDDGLFNAFEEGKIYHIFYIKYAQDPILLSAEYYNI